MKGRRDERRPSLPPPTSREAGKIQSPARWGAAHRSDGLYPTLKEFLGLTLPSHQVHCADWRRRSPEVPAPASCKASWDRRATLAAGGR